MKSLANLHFSAQVNNRMWCVILYLMRDVGVCGTFWIHSNQGWRMNKERLEAFSDGLFSVVITIMVLELRVPVGHISWAALGNMMPMFLTYLLSFVYGGIFWINHHYLLAATKRVNSGILWANLNFLFWLTLIPFFTAWVDENQAAPVPVAAYGALLLVVILSYRLLEWVLFGAHHGNALIVRTLRQGQRERASIVALILAIILAFNYPYAAVAIYVGVAIMWFLPDRELEDALND